jgi:hypothetical protein
MLLQNVGLSRIAPCFKPEYHSVLSHCHEKLIPKYRISVKDIYSLFDVAFNIPGYTAMNYMLIRE